jgi:hypothetical protein
VVLCAEFSLNFSAELGFIEYSAGILRGSCSISTVHLMLPLHPFPNPLSIPLSGKKEYLAMDGDMVGYLQVLVDGVDPNGEKRSHSYVLPNSLRSLRDSTRD